MSAATATTLSQAVRDTIQNIPDFPKPGILFRDFTPVLKDPKLFEQVIDWFAEQLKDQRVDYIVGIESRGFILGIPLAQKLGIGFIPARKQGKLPGLVEQYHYDLEYGTDCIEMHKDAFDPGANIVVVDDLLATGGTLNATINLVRRLAGNVVASVMMVELLPLQGRKALPQEIPLHALVQYED